MVSWLSHCNVVTAPLAIPDLRRGFLQGNWGTNVAKLKPLGQLTPEEQRQMTPLEAIRYNSPLPEVDYDNQYDPSAASIPLLYVPDRCSWQSQEPAIVDGAGCGNC